MLAAIQRVLPPRTQILFHHHGSDVSEPGRIMGGHELSASENLLVKSRGAARIRAGRGLWTNSGPCTYTV